MNTLKILFVCTGNICRSPTADGILRARVKKLGLENLIHVDSAGTSNYHCGEAPDVRSQRAANKRGIDLSALRARAVQACDFTDFDLLLALDTGHLETMRAKAPEKLHHKIHLLLPYVGITSPHDVPDPYYGGGDGFEHVLDLLEDACERLMNKLLDTMEEDHGCVSHGACGCAR